MIIALDWITNSIKFTLLWWVKQNDCSIFLFFGIIFLEFNDCWFFVRRWRTWAWFWKLTFDIFFKKYALVVLCGFWLRFYYWSNQFLALAINYRSWRGNKIAIANRLNKAFSNSHPWWQSWIQSIVARHILLPYLLRLQRNRLWIIIVESAMLKRFLRFDLRLFWVSTEIRVHFLLFSDLLTK